MDTTDEYGAPISNLPPLAWLSGLSFTNPESISGAATSLSGSGIGQSGRGIGMTGGMGLDALTQLLMEQRGGGEGVGVGSAGDLLSAITGNIGQGSLSQGGQGYSIAGQSAAPQPTRQGQGYTAGQSQSGGINPMALIKQALGLGKTIAGAFNTPGAPITQSDISGSDPQAFAAYRTGERQDFTGGAPPDAALGELGINTDLASLMQQLGLGFTPNQTLTPAPGSPMSSLDMLRETLQPGGGAGYSPTGAAAPQNLTLTNTYQAPGQTGAFDPFSEFGLANLEPQGADFLPRGYATGPTPAEQSLTGGSPDSLLQALTPQTQDLLGSTTAPLPSGGTTPAPQTLDSIVQDPASFVQTVSAPIKSGLGVINSLSPEIKNTILSILPTLLGTAGKLSGNQDVGTAGSALGGGLATYKAAESILSGTATSSLSGGLGAAGGALGAIGAVLGILAQQTGNADLGKAAQAAGAAASAIATTTAVTSAISAAASGATVGITTAAGAAFAPIAAALIISTISGLAGGEDPFGEGIADMMKPLMGDAPSFYKDLGMTLEGSRSGLGTLATALPYAQSQEDLGQMLDAFKAMQGQRIGGYGAGSDRFMIPNLPGAGGSVHEGGQIADFGPDVNRANELIRAYRGLLPAAAPEGSLRGADLWSTVATNRARERARATGLDLDMLNHLAPDQRAEVLALYPEPYAMPASTSAAWQQLMQPQQAITPEMIQALLQMLPQSPAQDSTGLMQLMQSMQPQQSVASQPIVDDETIRKMFQQYGLA